MKQYKIAVFGIAHMHIKMLCDSFLSLGNRVVFTGYTDIGTCYDFHKRLEETFPYKDIPYFPVPEELMATQPDIALVCCENSDHAAVAVELLRRGIVTIIEKPLSASIDDARKIYQVSIEYKTPFIINWPVAWFSAFREAHRLTSAGAIGRPLRFIYRTTSSMGPYAYVDGVPAMTKWDEYKKNAWWFIKERGGGALLDYCCYGSIMACWFLGANPRSVYGHKRRFMLPDGTGDADDYAQLTINFNESVGYAEGSWSTINTGGIPTGPVVFGTEGTLVADRYANDVRIYKQRNTFSPDGVYEPAAQGETLAQNVLAYLEEGKPLHPLIDFDLNMKTAAVLDAGIRSCESKKLEPVINYSTGRIEK